MGFVSLCSTLIQEISGPEVQLVDTGESVVAELSRRLGDQGLLSLEENKQPPRFYTSALPARMEPILAHFWGEAAEMLPLP